MDASFQRPELECMVPSHSYLWVFQVNPSTGQRPRPEINPLVNAFLLYESKVPINL
jgi:hypothetical protein